MDEGKGKILMDNAVEYFSSAEESFGKGRNNSAVIMYFKCLVSLCDLYLLRELGETPSSHSKRFRILKEKFPDIYDIIDKDFPFYQGSYVQTMTKELAEVVRDDVKIVAKKAKVKIQ